MVDPSPTKSGGWQNLDAPASEGWSLQLLDDSTLCIVGIRRTRDERGNVKTFYRQVTTAKETRRLRRKLAKVIEHDKKEEREARKLRLLLRAL